MRKKLVILILGDLLLALLAFYTGFLLRFGYHDAKVLIMSRPYDRTFLFVFTLLVDSYIFEIFHLDKHRTKKEICSNILIAVAVSFIILSIIFFINPDLMIGRGLLVLSLAAFVLFQFLWHVIFIIGIGHPYLAEKLIVLGVGPLALRTGELIKSSGAHFNHKLIGYLLSEYEKEKISVPSEQIIGNANDTLQIALREKVARIIVSLPERGGVLSLRDVLLNCKLNGIEVIDTPLFFEQLTSKLMLESMNITWLIYSNGFRRTALMSAIKRMADICLSVIGIIIVLPFIPFIALLVKLDSPGPVFFRQVRVGHWAKEFVLYKFRTMGQDAELETGAVWAQENDPRIKTIGRFLRKCRLDEIPQLYNVLIGDMSFVGPRPERPEFVHKLNDLIPFYPKRHFIKPGITGWAQINYPYGASVEDAFEKLRYDLYYLKHMSPLFDTIIMLQTIKVVIFANGGR
jgi:sugar transferase (PEP-CTERM system associated)